MSALLAAMQLAIYYSLMKERRERERARMEREERERLPTERVGAGVLEDRAGLDAVHYLRSDSRSTPLWLADPERQLKWVGVGEVAAAEPRVALTAEDVVSGRFVEYLRRLAERWGVRG